MKICKHDYKLEFFAHRYRKDGISIKRVKYVCSKCGKVKYK